MKTGEHFVGKGSFSLEHMNSGLETCRKDDFRLYSTVYNDSCILPPIVFLAQQDFLNQLGQA